MSEPIKIASEADVILSVKLPVRCSVLGLLVDGLVIISSFLLLIRT